MDDKQDTNEICVECEAERFARGALAILRSLATVGIEALLDEVTGAQDSRPDGELARRFMSTVQQHEC